MSFVLQQNVTVYEERGSAHSAYIGASGSHHRSSNVIGGELRALKHLDQLW